LLFFIVSLIFSTKTQSGMADANVEHGREKWKE